MDGALSGEHNSTEEMRLESSSSNDLKCHKLPDRMKKRHAAAQEVSRKCRANTACTGGDVNKQGWKTMSKSSKSVCCRYYNDCPNRLVPPVSLTPVHLRALSARRTSCSSEGIGSLLVSALKTSIWIRVNQSTHLHFQWICD